MRAVRRTDAARRIAELEAERDRLYSTLAASCDDEREQFWEATNGGGCPRALTAEAELTRLRAELSEARKDAERLNAAEQRKFYIEPPLREPSTRWAISQDPHGRLASGATLRAAIDAAIQKEQP